MEPGLTRTFQEALNLFRERAGLTTPGDYHVVAHNGQNYDQGNPGERTLDVAVVTSANPNSTMGLYAGSGFGNHASSNSVTAYQAAFWDLVHNPAVVSSSFGIFQQAAPGSPFASAIRELFIDAALRNISVFVANNDWGSSYNFSNGIANQNITLSSPYAVMVGGTSISDAGRGPERRHGRGAVWPRGGRRPGDVVAADGRRPYGAAQRRVGIRCRPDHAARSGVEHLHHLRTQDRAGHR